MGGNCAPDRPDLPRGDGLIDAALLQVLACPVCDERPPLEQRGEYLVCTLRGHGYPIVDQIPHLLPENAIEPEKMKELLDAR